MLFFLYIYIKDYYLDLLLFRFIYIFFKFQTVLVHF